MDETRTILLSTQESGNLVDLTDDDNGMPKVKKGV
jgi:hypothetical protein